MHACVMEREGYIVRWVGGGEMSKSVGVCCMQRSLAICVRGPKFFFQSISEWLAKMANGKWHDVTVNGVTS